MQLRKVSVVLLALLLAVIVVVPLVSAENDENSDVLKTSIEANYVPVETAWEHAAFALNEFAGQGALGQKENWMGSTVDQNPVIIYDTSGTKLFYLFEIERKGSKIGEIKVAATKIIGTSIFTIGPEKNSLDIAILEQKVKTEVIREVKADTPITTNLVSYDYPKLGMMASYRDPLTGAMKRVIIDAYDYSIVPETAPRYEGDRGIVSFYANYPSDKQSDLISSWSQYDQVITRIEGNSPSIKDQFEGQVTEESLQLVASGSSITKAITEYKVLSPFPLIGAKTTEWCTVGTAAMISQWHGVIRTQTAIATRMGIPTTAPYRGATVNEELNYYQGSIASGGLGKTNSLDYYTINWDDSKYEINQNRPFKVGNNGHARAMTGYMRSSSSGYTYFYFKDPAPLNQGSEYWEWFNELNPYFYNNHIKIK